MSLRYFDYYQQLEEKLRVEEPLMIQAGTWIAQRIAAGGRLQIFASRTLSGVAFEFWEQLPDIVPGKLIKNPADGIYERLEGTGQAIIEQIETNPQDIFLLLSNEGRNPAIIELAQWIKEHEYPVIIVTGFDLSRSIKSQHSSGLRLFEIADLVLDNHAKLHDAVLTIPELDPSICGTASVSTMFLLQQMLYFIAQFLLKKEVSSD
ncbi:SIS domain-containing protein [Enterococcus sp. DIV0660C]|uniref:SIS domain-containing protein n=1 Tax=Enterococcus sp. DIV0660C TaxID=2230880 RepID=UPI001A8F0914|nr:SIS domain-containing protein [Enterococcus sp. DIV0660C]MBO0431841.1 SIS domain-containing protein [Enterococcus sp. DIV0660C]